MVDKLVGDIYGEDYKGLGLSADTVIHTATTATTATYVSRIHVVMCSHAAILMCFHTVIWPYDGIEAHMTALRAI